MTTVAKVANCSGRTMLHSCGQHINISAYHKHTWYLIRHGELLGFRRAHDGGSHCPLSPPQPARSAMIVAAVGLARKPSLRATDGLVAAFGRCPGRELNR